MRPLHTTGSRRLLTVGKKCEFNPLSRRGSSVHESISRLQVNHISAALLTLLLLPNLLQSAEKSGDLSRVTIVSSGNHATKKFTKEDIPGDILAHLNNEKFFEGKVLLGRYPESKRQSRLSNVLRPSYLMIFDV